MPRPPVSRRRRPTRGDRAPVPSGPGLPYHDNGHGPGDPDARRAARHRGQPRPPPPLRLPERRLDRGAAVLRALRLPDHGGAGRRPAGTARRVPAALLLAADAPHLPAVLRVPGPARGRVRGLGAAGTVPRKRVGALHLYLQLHSRGAGLAAEPLFHALLVPRGGRAVLPGLAVARACALAPRARRPERGPRRA